MDEKTFHSAFGRLVHIAKSVCSSSLILSLTSDRTARVGDNVQKQIEMAKVLHQLFDLFDQDRSVFRVCCNVLTRACFVSDGIVDFREVWQSFISCSLLTPLAAQFWAGLSVLCGGDQSSKIRCTPFARTYKLIDSRFRSGIRCVRSRQ